MDGEWMSRNTGIKHIKDIDNMWNEKTGSQAIGAQGYRFIAMNRIYWG